MPRSRRTSGSVPGRRLTKRRPSSSPSAFRDGRMTEMLKFVQSDQQSHRRFGSKLELIYRMVNPSAAIAEAQRRQAEAARARTVTGGGQRPSEPDGSGRVPEAKTGPGA